MVNGILRIFGKLTDPVYWCIGFVAAMGPVVVPAPFGVIAGGLVGLAMLFGLRRIERMDETEVSGEPPLADNRDARTRRRRSARVWLPRIGFRSHA